MGLVDYLSLFSEQKILVLGDMIADEFVTGTPERISREAPVPILEEQNRKILPGGGCNAANNVGSLGAEVKLAGVIGDDLTGRRLTKKLTEVGLDTDGLIIDNSRPTSVKTRILAGGGETVKQQVVRVDKLETAAVKKEIETKLLNYVKEIMPQIDGVLLSDYGNGVFTESLKQKVIKLARNEGKIVAADSRYQLPTFKGVTIATPNKEETEEIVGFKLDSQERIEKAGWQLKEKLAAEAMLITLGGKGMQLFTDEKTVHIPASNYTEVYDVTGAGDTVIGSLILALASGASFVEAMKIANYAAGTVIRKLGVATVSPTELKEVINGIDEDDR